MSDEPRVRSHLPPLYAGIEAPLTPERWAYLLDQAREIHAAPEAYEHAERVWAELVIDSDKNDWPRPELRRLRVQAVGGSKPPAPAK